MDMIEIDESSYEFGERMAILIVDGGLHPAHARNKARKEIGERMARMTEKAQDDELERWLSGEW